MAIAKKWVDLISFKLKEFQVDNTVGSFQSFNIYSKTDIKQSRQMLIDEEICLRDNIVNTNQKLDKPNKINILKIY